MYKQFTPENWKEIDKAMKKIVNKQLTIEKGLFEKEKEQLRLMDALVQLARESAYITNIANASAGNYHAKTKQNKGLANGATFLHFANHWIAMLRYVVGNHLTGYKGKTVDEYIQVALPPYGYSREQVKTPLAVYDGYVKLLSSVTLTCKQNQKAIDRAPKGNRLVSCLFDSLQTAGEHFEQIV